MTAESLQKQIDKQKITDRAMELFGSQSPHQLAVTLAHFEAKHAEAMSALDRMTDQRDQLAAQLHSLRCATADVIAISDRKHDAWDRAKSLLAAAPKPEGQ